MAEGGEEAVTSKQSSVLCHICEVTQPSLCCDVCKQSMCDACKKQHDRVRNFDSHAVTPLCEKHGRPLTHICHNCIAGMCIKCILTDHIDHDCGKGFDTFSEGVESLRRRSQELEQKVKDRAKRMNNELLKGQIKLKETKNVKVSLKKLRAIYVDKISKVDNLLNDIEEKYESKGETVCQGFEDMLVQCSKLTPALATKDKSDQEVIEIFASNDLRVQEWLQTSMDLLSVGYSGMQIDNIGDEYSLCLEEAGVILSVDVTKKAPKLIMSYRGEGQHKAALVDVLALSKDTAIVSDYGHGAFSIHKEGRLLRKYSSSPRLRAAAIQGEDCYFLRSDSLTKVCLENPVDSSSVNLGMSAVLPGICSTSPNEFLITSWENKAVYQVTFGSNENKKIIQANSNLWAITKTMDSTYLVTCPFENCVNEYNEQWALVRTIGCKGEGDGQLNGPRGITTTSSGHILVADRGNNRITCFNRDGSFNKHILTKADGMCEPYGLDFRSPLLWVAEHKGCVKCYDFSK